MAINDIVSPSAEDSKEFNISDDSPIAAKKVRKPVEKKRTHKGSIENPMKLGIARPGPASSRNLSVLIPVGKKETVKFSCAPEQPNSGLFREITINVDEDSDLPSVSPTHSSPMYGSRANASARDGDMSVKSKQTNKMK